MKPRLCAVTLRHLADEDANDAEFYRDIAQNHTGALRNESLRLAAYAKCRARRLRILATLAEKRGGR